jgi:DNA-binding transcriptional MerR regulator
MQLAPGAPTQPNDEITIDELARSAKLPVRTIREYQTLRLLPSPVRRGRIGMYGATHRERLALIARLQRRGYSLAGIRDLLDSFEAGADLPALLGVDLVPFALDEVPQRLTRDEIRDRVPALDDAMLQRACDVGLLQADDGDAYFVRSPALLTLVADGIATGVTLPVMLDFVVAIRNHLYALAATIADRLIDDIWEPLEATDRRDEIEPFLRRGRPLLLQAVASLLADGLGDALSTGAQKTTSGEALRASLERIRIGAVIDGHGNLEQRAHK